MYRLVFSDLDETLLAGHRVPDMNKEAIMRLKENGIKFVPATGRAYNMIGDILNDINTYDKEDEYSICFNGCLIVENKNNKILHFKGLDYELAEEIFYKANDYDVCVLVFTLDCCYIFRADPLEVQRKIDQKAPFKVIDDFDISFLKNDKIAKVLFERRDMDYIMGIRDDLYPLYKDKVSITSSSERYLEFNALNINKGTGVLWLANYLGVSVEECAAIGDSHNDIEMIQMAGLGACVLNAHDDVKAITDVLIEKDYLDGAVKEFIDNYILEE